MFYFRYILIHGKELEDLTTGQRIGDLAKRKKINLHKLADLAGISYNTLYSIVRRKSDKVDLETVHKIALALDVPPIEILGDTSLELIDYGMDMIGRGLKAAGRTVDTDVTMGDIIAAYSDEGVPLKEKREIQEGFSIVSAAYDAIEAEQLRQKMLFLFDSLNVAGKEKAVEMMEIMAGNPYLQHPDHEEQPEAPAEGNTPPTQEKPPEGPAAPPDGK